MRSPRTIDVSRPDKLLWPGIGITKRDYVDYLEAVSSRMVPWLQDRPLTLVRAPDGVDGKRYFQKDTPSYAPSWIPTVTIEAPSAARDVAYTVCNNAATLAWLGNQAALEFHPAPVRRDRLERPDLLVVDIDPPDDAFEAAVDVAFLVLEVLDEFGLTSVVKTTGGKGLHIVVPIERRVDPSALRRAAARLTTIVAGRHPDRVTSEFRKAARGGRVMLDPSRNGTGATIVAPYSPRARPDGTVSFPVSPDELGSIAPGEFTLATALDRLDGAGPALWDAIAADRRQRLPAELTAHDERSQGVGDGSRG